MFPPVNIPELSGCVIFGNDSNISMLKVYLNILEVSIIFFAISKVLHLEQLITRLFVQNTGIVSNYTVKTYRRPFQTAEGSFCCFGKYTFPVFPGGNTKGLPECPVEGGMVTVAKLPAHQFQRHSLADQIPGLLHP